MWLNNKNIFNSSGNSVSYRYGFNGKEKDDEVNVSGGDYDFGARIYDSRLGRWLSVDPLYGKYPFCSPYVFAINNPTNAIDPDGRVVIFINGQHTGEWIFRPNRPQFSAGY